MLRTPSDEVHVGVTVEISVKPGVDPFERVTGNGGDDFRRQTYGYLIDRQQCLNHWAYNAVANGITDASALDGWADLNPGDVTMLMRWVEVDTDA